MSTVRPILNMLKNHYSVRAAEAQMAALQTTGQILDAQAQYAKLRMNHAPAPAPKPEPKPQFSPSPSIKPGFVF